MDTYTQRIEDLFVTALEGGSNYWALFDINLSNSQRQEMKAIGSLSEYLFDQVMNHGQSYLVYDLEDEEELLGEINKANLKRGYKLLKEDYEEDFADVVQGSYDANTADIFLQLAVIGELTFG